MRSRRSGSKEVLAIARRIERAARDARKLGITVFGGSGSGSLRFDEGGGSSRALILADLDGAWDDGDGATREDENGLRRGEGN